MQPFSVESAASALGQTTPLQPKGHEDGKKRGGSRTASIILTIAALVIVILVIVQNESGSVRPKRETAIEETSPKTSRKIAAPSWPIGQIESDQSAGPMLQCGQTWQGQVSRGSIANFRFRTPVAASVTFDTCGSMFDTVLSVRSGGVQVWGCDNCGPCTRQAGGTLAIPSVLRNGIVYGVQIRGANAAQGGQARLRVDCAGIPVTCGTTQRATTQPFVRAIYAITVPANGESVTFDTCRAGYDTQMFVFQGTNPGRNQIWSCDDCGPCSDNFRETITFQVRSGGGSTGGIRNLIPSRPYTFAIGGYEDSSGNMVVDIRCRTRGTTTARPSLSPTTRRPSGTPTRPQPTSVPSTSSPTTLTPSRSPATSRPTRQPVSTTSPPGCGPRIRRDWMEISQAERDLYVQGFLALYRQGKIATLTRTHLQNEQWAHNLNVFFPWHRYFIWELEEQIRALGGAYRCFTLPYWEWTRNSGNERNNPMFTHGLGGDGNGQCLQTGAFRQGQYRITTGQCLIRQFDNGATPFPTTQATMRNMMEQPVFDTYRQTVEFGGHGAAHNFLGGFEGIISTMQSPDDPFFYLIHANVDFLWALWQDCHQYDTVAASSITSNSIYPVNELDSTMDFANGQDSLVNAPWARVTANNQMTPRRMHNIRGSFLQYQYHTSILSRSGLDFSRCTFGSWILRPSVTEVAALMSARHHAEWVAIELDRKANAWMKDLEMKGEIAEDGYFSGRRKKWQRKRFWRKQKLWHHLTPKQRNNMIAQLACEQSKFLEYENGGPEPCEFDPDRVQGCGPAPKNGPDTCAIPLRKMLRKRGVRNNKCLKRVRRTFYKWAKLMGPGALRALCNGVFEKRLTCNYGGF